MYSNAEQASMKGIGKIKKAINSKQLHVHH
jgi:hypothetical protein